MRPHLRPPAPAPIPIPCCRALGGSAVPEEPAPPPASHGLPPGRLATRSSPPTGSPARRAPNAPRRDGRGSRTPPSQSAASPLTSAPAPPPGLSSLPHLPHAALRRVGAPAI